MNGNGNGEVQKLVALKHGYKDEVAQLEADLKAKFQQELEQGKKDLKDKYLEKLVDWFYSNGFNEQPPAPPPEPVAEPESTPTQGPGVEVTVTPSTPVEETTEQEEPETESALSTPVCEGCGSTLEPADKFCSQCATPVEAETQTNSPSGTVAPAGRITGTTRARMISAARKMAEKPAPGNSNRRSSDWPRTQRR